MSERYTIYEILRCVMDDEMICVS